MVARDWHTKKAKQRASACVLRRKDTPAGTNNAVPRGSVSIEPDALNRFAIDQVNHWSVSPAVSDRAVPDHRSV